MALHEYRHENCFEAQVQHGQVFYKVSIPYRMCQPELPDLDGILNCIQQAHPEPTKWRASLKMYNIDTAPWTALNAQLLPEQLYILLGESGMYTDTQFVKL